MKSPTFRKIENNPKPTQAKLLAEPVTHRLYFKSAQDFTREKVANNTLHKLRVEVCTPRGRVLEYKETVGRIVVWITIRIFCQRILTLLSSISTPGI